jgi:DNA recombination protein RmuC
MEIALVLIGLVVGLAAGWFGASRVARGREDLLTRNGELADLVAPLRDTLEQVESQLAAVERGRAASDSALREQVLSMRQSSEHLVTALRAPQVRGRWGEVQLERVLEAAGMTEHVDYDLQVTRDADGTIVRPDLVVHLTNGRSVVVDSKVAFSGYLEAMQAPDEPTRKLRMRAHAKHLRQHVDSLAAKAYWQQFEPTPEFVVCFVPADAFLDAALSQDPGLLEDAFGRNVVLATPSTLVALLRTVAYTWRQQELAANADEVHELGRQLYERLATLGAHFDKLGRSLGSAVSAYNEAVGSMEKRVLTKARQFQTLGVVDSGASLAPLTPLTDAVPRVHGTA